MRILVDGVITREQQALWKQGKLQRRWAKQHPDLFDADDMRLATTSQHKLGYHFVEWIAAIAIFHLMGHRSLVSKYQFGSHRSKVAVVERLGGDALAQALRLGTKDASRGQAPDLLCYSADLSSYFFCEVKGPGDRLTTAQRDRYRELSRLTGAEVCLAHFRWGTPKTARAAG